MTAWDLRSFLRALGATILGIVVVWLVTAASDEGQLTIGVRAGRTLPLAPLCSAVGAALALGTARVRSETFALEALGRSPAQAVRAAVLGASLPSLLVAVAIAVSSAVDISAFYPRAPKGDTFVYRDGAFESPTLGVRVESDGEPRSVADVPVSEDASLPSGARGAAALATALAGVALALMATRAVVPASLLAPSAQRRRRIASILLTGFTALFTVIAFQAAAARAAEAALAAVPAAALLGIALLGYRSRHEHAR